MESHLCTLRRTIHANPELPFQEFATAKLAAHFLEAFGFKITAGIGGSGFIAEKGSGKTVAIRADMDALPINEMNQVAYRSCKLNVMHACGHDAHVAAVLGAAEILCKNGLDGRLRIIMQPAEASADQNGNTGSFYMIENGAMEGVDAILGLHVDATLETGKVGVIGRPLIDLHNRYEFRFNENGSDLVASSNKLVAKLIEQARCANWQASEFKIVKVNADNESRFCSILGTFSSDEVNQSTLVLELEKLGNSLGFQLKTDSNEKEIAAHKQIIATTHSACADLLGQENVNLVRRRSWTRDFSAYASTAPASFFLIGTETHGHRAIQHSPTFDIDERALPIAAAVLAESTKQIFRS